MLPLGHIGIRSNDGTGAAGSGFADRRSRFTPDEQRTMMSLWSIFRSPLMVGGELRDNDAATLALLTNPEAMEANQRGAKPRPVAARDGRGRKTVVWASEAPDGGTYLALFNLDGVARRVGCSWADIGVAGGHRVRDLWARADLGSQDGRVELELPSHGSALLKVAR